MKRLKVTNGNVRCSSKGYVSSKICISCDECFGIITFGGERRTVLCKLGVKQDKIIHRKNINVDLIKTPKTKDFYS